MRISQYLHGRPEVIQGVFREVDGSDHPDGSFHL